MESVPRAVATMSSTESGSDHVQADSKNRDCQDCYPVATALGTDDLMTQEVSVPKNWSSLDYKLQLDS